MKYHISALTQPALSQVTTGEGFVDAVQFLSVMDQTYIQLHFRKLNGLCLSIYSKNYKKFSPKDHVVILQSLKKIGISHSSIKKAMQDYIIALSTSLDNLDLTDLISYMKLLTQDRLIKNVDKIYNSVFDNILKEYEDNPKAFAIYKFKMLVSILPH